MSNIIKLPGVPVDVVEFLQELVNAAQAGEIKGIAAAIITKDDGLIPLWSPLDASVVYLGGAVIQNHAMNVLLGRAVTGYDQVRKVLDPKPDVDPPRPKPCSVRVLRPGEEPYVD